jgi:hypothetical protein
MNTAKPYQSLKGPAVPFCSHLLIAVQLPDKPWRPDLHRTEYPVIEPFNCRALKWHPSSLPHWGGKGRVSKEKGTANKVMLVFDVEFSQSPLAAALIENS